MSSMMSKNVQAGTVVPVLLLPTSGPNEMSQDFWHTKSLQPYSFTDLR